VPGHIPDLFLKDAPLFVGDHASNFAFWSERRLVLHDFNLHLIVRHSGWKDKPLGERRVVLQSEVGTDDSVPIDSFQPFIERRKPPDVNPARVHGTVRLLVRRPRVS